MSDFNGYRLFFFFQIWLWWCRCDWKHRPLLYNRHYGIWCSFVLSFDIVIIISVVSWSGVRGYVPVGERERERCQSFDRVKWKVELSLLFTKQMASMRWISLECSSIIVCNLIHQKRLVPKLAQCALIFLCVCVAALPSIYRCKILLHEFTSRNGWMKTKLILIVWRNE